MVSVRKSKWTEEKLAFLKENSDKLLLKELEKELDINRNTISRKARMLNLPLKNSHERFSEDELKFLQENSDKYSLNELASIMNRSKSNISKIISEKNLKLKNEFTGNKYHYRKDYFSIIDSEDKAYWLGFIYADGCVYEGEGRMRLKITLKRADRHLLEEFNKSINGNISIKDEISKYNGGSAEVSTIVVNCTEMCRDLVKLNINPRKTYRNDIPLVPKEYMRHFIRGFVDGDGCFYFLKSQNRLRYSLEVISLGTEFLEGMKQHLKDELGIESYIYQKKDGNLRYKLTISKLEDIYKFIEYIYEDATIFLDRKFQKASLIKEAYLNRQLA